MQKFELAMKVKRLEICSKLNKIACKMSVMHVVLISQLDVMHVKFNKPTKSQHQPSPKDGEIGISMGKIHLPKPKFLLVVCYNEIRASWRASQGIDERIQCELLKQEENPFK